MERTFQFARSTWISTWMSSCPTLILVGEHDPSTPPSVARGLAEAIRREKMVVISDASHIVTVEGPATVNDALEAFLKALEDCPAR
jgi:pimeloyl-ACP methyl ester carboxylesterase